MSKEEIEIDHTKDGFCVRIPLITEQELKRIDDNLDGITDEITKQVIRNKDLAIAQHIIQKQKERIARLEQGNKILKHTNKSYKGIINKQSEGKKKVIKELNKRMCNFADKLEPETILKYGEIKMEDIDNNTYELLAVYTLGLLVDIYKIVKEEG